MDLNEEDGLMGIEFIGEKFLDNTLNQWLSALVAFFVCLSILVLLRRFLVRRADRIAARIEGYGYDELLADLLKKTKLFLFLAWSTQMASAFLTLSEKRNATINKAIMVATLLQVAIWGGTIIRFWIARVTQQRTQNGDAAMGTTLGLMSFLLRAALYLLVVLLILNNLGFDITALVAGLGVGGIAIALAVQNILGDLFASLSIVLDKPFVVGDFINVDGLMGDVEHIGLKTTRVRSISGEQLIFPNSNLLQSRVRNFKRMNKRRVLFNIGVIYNTSSEKLARIPEIIKTAIQSQKNTRFDRCHFLTYGDSALIFETVYWVEDRTFNVYADTHHAINLEIYNRFRSEGIEFAYPTQTIHLANHRVQQPVREQ